jgi:hypothetical protein
MAATWGGWSHTLQCSVLCQSTDNIVQIQQDADANALDAYGVKFPVP